MFLVRRSGLVFRLCGHPTSSKHAHLRGLSTQPNPSLNLDSTLQAFLADGDMSLGKGYMPKHYKELEVVAFDQKTEALKAIDVAEDANGSLERKSPAAHYGSHQIGAVILPNQLQNAINAMISGGYL